MVRSVEGSLERGGVNPDATSEGVEVDARLAERDQQHATQAMVRGPSARSHALVDWRDRWVLWRHS